MHFKLSVTLLKPMFTLFIELFSDAKPKTMQTVFPVIAIATLTYANERFSIWGILTFLSVIKIPFWLDKFMFELFKVLILNASKKLLT